MSIDSVHKYIQEKQVHLLESELKDSPQLVLKADNDGRTPLMWALSESQNAEIVSIVLKAANQVKNFDINTADEAGFTPLHISASLGPLFVEQILQFDPTVDSRTNQGQTPLFLAVSKQQIEAAKLLIEHKASVRSKDKRQVTLLQRAVGIGSLTLTKLLLENGAPVNATDMYGWTALHYAYAEARSDVIKVLLDAGADPNLKSKEEELPQDVCAKGFKYK